MLVDAKWTYKSRVLTRIAAQGVHRDTRYAAAGPDPPDGSAMSTFWRYVKIQLMVFVFGCVGPIFLTIYFATQPDPTTKFFYWAGLFITAADVLIALGLTSASDPDKEPAGIRVATAVAKRMQSGRSSDHESYSSSD
jgi:hypothetical protein